MSDISDKKGNAMITNNTDYPDEPRTRWLSETDHYPVLKPRTTDDNGRRPVRVYEHEQRGFFRSLIRLLRGC